MEEVPQGETMIKSFLYTCFPYSVTFCFGIIWLLLSCKSASFSSSQSNCETIYEYKSVTNYGGRFEHVEEATITSCDTAKFIKLEVLVYNKQLVDTLFGMNRLQVRKWERLVNSFKEYNVPEGYYSGFQHDAGVFLLKSQSFNIQLASNNLFDLFYYLTGKDIWQDYFLKQLEDE